MVSINTNIASLVAQQNLSRADSMSQTSIARLSSGNRIISASDDAAGLAVGTGLRTDVSTLRTALTNSSQANSVLSIADGALFNIGEILQRQKALASQANSGSLSDTERLFLDSEFQNLTQEIDRIADSTNFNGIKLIDGSIAESNGIETNTTGTDSKATATVVFDATVADADVAAIVTINGIGFGTTATATSGDVNASATTIDIDSDGGITATQFAQAVADIINNTTDSTGLGDFTGNAHDSITSQAKIDALQGLTATASAGTLTITSKQSGTAGTFTVVLTDATEITSVTAGDESETVTGEAVAAVASGASDTTGSLGEGSVTASGTIGDDILTTISNTKATLSQTFVSTDVDADGDVFTAFGRQYTIRSTVTNADTEIKLGSTDAETVANIASFLNQKTDPTVSKFTYDVTTENGLILRATSKTETASQDDSFGFIDEATDETDLTAGAAGGIDVSKITDNADFVGVISGFSATHLGNDTVSLSVTVGDYTYEGIVQDTSPAADTVVRLRSTNSDGSGGYFDITLESTATGTLTVTSQTQADAYAQRINDAFSSINFQQTRSIDSFDLSGTLLEGGRIYLESEDFTDVNVSNVLVKQASSSNSDQSTITITLEDGRVFENTSLGTELHAGELITLSNVDNSNEKFTIINGARTIQLDNASQAARLQTELTTGFATGAGGLDFQIGIEAQDTIAVVVGGASSAELFDGATLDLTSVANAIAAGNQLDEAINTVTSLRASIGALQSRFDFASSNLETTIQNTDAARGDFLDADVASESTDFATNQVLLQASISVLAQANQLPQNLLKLIG